MTATGSSRIVSPGRQEPTDGPVSQVEGVPQLLAGLEAMSPALRASCVADLMSVIRRHGGDAAAVSTPGAAREPVLIYEWAQDRGAVDGRQHLGVDIAPGPVPVAKTRAATGRSLVTNGHLGADLLHVPAGEGFAPHTHPGDHLLFVVGGRGTITVHGTITETRPGQVYMVEGATPHAVGAITDHVILAIGAPHRRLESPDRQHLTEYSAVLTEMGSLACRICDIVSAKGEELEASGCTHAPQRFG